MIKRFDHKKLNIIFLSILILMTLFSSIISSRAADTGEITIHIKPLENTKSLDGVQFNVFRVGVLNEGDKQPVIDEKYGISLPETAEEYDAAATKIIEQLGSEADYFATTDAEGTARFINIPEGVYLITATNTEKYGVISPFFLIMPYYDNLTKEFVYSIDVEPKAVANESDPPGPPDDTSKTGDEAPIGIILGVLLFALVGLIMIIGIKKYERKGKEEEEKEDE